MTRGAGPDYPVVLSLAGRPCLVVGAGPVAARKAAGLLEAGADVTVVAPDVSESMAALIEAAGQAAVGAGGGMRLEHRPYRDGDARGAAFVIAATGVPAVDRKVTEEALALGALVNGAPDDHVGAVRLPALFRRGAVTVSVSTGGRSPALARWTRDHLAAAPGPDLAFLCELLEEARAETGPSPRSTQAADWAAAIEHVVPLLEAGRVDEARQHLARALRR
ncbi:MAG: bifunctional precorrin-2 dehydrogenase/sirohydrochlorin ferrochelatase [Acidimicrobiales bacterium]|nr:bifunctional precorrin-2 dehydrogenase/sirohydrochlorin ferrochelatase [Acidimicrobiales bacterium]